MDPNEGLGPLVERHRRRMPLVRGGFARWLRSSSATAPSEEQYCWWKLAVRHAAVLQLRPVKRASFVRLARGEHYRTPPPPPDPVPRPLVHDRAVRR
jgi:hypothetical protein